MQTTAERRGAANGGGQALDHSEGMSRRNCKDSGAAALVARTNWVNHR